MTKMSIRGISLNVKVTGHGYPLALMHGGPGADLTTLEPFLPCADQFTLVFYDHRCNGHSMGPDVSSMTWENLTADADALRQKLGFEKWAVLGHSFGGMVALEYALRYPNRLSHLVLLDTCGDIQWAMEHAPDELAKRGFSPKTVALARRFFHGQIVHHEMMLSMMTFGRAYFHHPGTLQMMGIFARELRTIMRPEALNFGFGTLLKGWNVMQRLGEIKTPTLVLAGKHDFQFPPEHQEALAAGIPNARLEIIEKAGHNSAAERPAEVMKAVREFLADTKPVSKNQT